MTSFLAQYDLILGTETIKKLGIVLDFKAKMITIDKITLPMRNIYLLQGASTLLALKLNNSLAMEPKSTQDATKCVTWILDAKYNKADIQSIVKDSCKHLGANQQKRLLQLLTEYELLFDGTIGDWKTKLEASLLSTKGRCNTIPWLSFPSTKNMQECPHQRS
jgi:hypothetical protein